MSNQNHLQQVSAQQMFYYAEFYFHQGQLYEAFESYKKAEAILETHVDIEEQNQLHYLINAQLLLLSCVLNIREDLEFYQLMCSQISIEHNWEHFEIEKALLTYESYFNQVFDSKMRLKRCLESTKHSNEEKLDLLLWTIEHNYNKYSYTEFQDKLNELLESHTPSENMFLNNRLELYHQIENLNYVETEVFEKLSQNLDHTKFEKMYLTKLWMTYNKYHQLSNTHAEGHFYKHLSNFSANTSTIWQNWCHWELQQTTHKTKIELLENNLKINDVIYLASANSILYIILNYLNISSEIELATIQTKLKDKTNLELQQNDLISEIRNLNRQLFQLTETKEFLVLENSRNNNNWNIRLNSKCWISKREN